MTNPHINVLKDPAKKAPAKFTLASGCLLVAAFMGGAGTLMIGGCYMAYNWYAGDETHKTVEFTVKDKQAVVRGTGDSAQTLYLIFTEEGPTYMMAPDALKKIFTVDKRYSDIEIGARYSGEIYGRENQDLGLYPNLMSEIVIAPVAAPVSAPAYTY